MSTGQTLSGVESLQSSHAGYGVVMDHGAAMRLEGIDHLGPVASSRRRNAEPHRPVRVVEREVRVGMFAGLEVGILADAEHAIAVLQERIGVTPDRGDGLAVGVAVDLWRGTLGVVPAATAALALPACILATSAAWQSQRFALFPHFALLYALYGFARARAVLSSSPWSGEGPRHR